MTSILTEDAFEVSRETLRARYKTDRVLLSQWRAVDRRLAVIQRGKKKIRKRLADFRMRQGKYLSKIYGRMATRRKAIRKVERMKLIRAAAAEFQRRVRKEEGLTAR